MQGARQVHLSSHYPTRVKGLGSSEERWGDGCNMLGIKLLDIFRTFIGKLKWKGRGDLTVGRQETSRKSRSRLQVYKDAPFQNWGLDIHFLPIYTCIPTTVSAVQRIVRYAKEHDLGVRCAGFGKSLSLFPCIIR
jgi:hypothetical protein